MSVGRALFFMFWEGKDEEPMVVINCQLFSVADRLGLFFCLNFEHGPVLMRDRGRTTLSILYPPCRMTSLFLCTDWFTVFRSW